MNSMKEQVLNSSLIEEIWHQWLQLILFKSSVFVEKASISYLSCGTPWHKDFCVNQENETLKAKQVEWRELEKNLNESSEEEVWCSWEVEAIESGSVRTVNNDNLSSSSLLWGKQNDSVVGIREHIVRRS